jgi:hypothetical protein
MKRNKLGIPIDKSIYEPYIKGHSIVICKRTFINLYERVVKDDFFNSGNWLKTSRALLALTRGKVLAKASISLGGKPSAAPTSLTACLTR